MSNGEISFKTLERALRRRKFGTLATVGGDAARPHATEVIYAMPTSGRSLYFYVTSRTTTRKVRNIRARPEVAFVVPLARLVAPWFPPRAVQFQGTADIVGNDDEGARDAFHSLWFLRRILSAEQRIVAQGGDLCFIRIRPDPVVFTYGMGTSVLQTIRQPKDVAGRVAIPSELLSDP